MDFVTTFIVPYVVLITLGLSVFNAWMLIIIAKKFFIKTPYPKDVKSVSSESQETQAIQPAEEKDEKKNKTKDLEEAPSMFVA